MYMLPAQQIRQHVRSCRYFRLWSSSLDQLGQHKIEHEDNSERCCEQSSLQPFKAPQNELNRQLDIYGTERLWLISHEAGMLLT